MRIANIWKSKGTLEGLLVRRKQSLSHWLSEMGFRSPVEVELWCAKAGFIVSDMNSLMDELDSQTPVETVDQQVIHFEKSPEEPKEPKEISGKSSRKRVRNALVQLSPESVESAGQDEENETSSSRN